MSFLMRGFQVSTHRFLNHVKYISQNNLNHGLHLKERECAVIIKSKKNFNLILQLMTQLGMTQRCCDYLGKSHSADI